MYIYIYQLSLVRVGGEDYRWGWSGSEIIKVYCLTFNSDFSSVDFLCRPPIVVHNTILSLIFVFVVFMHIQFKIQLDFRWNYTVFKPQGGYKSVQI